MGMQKGMNPQKREKRTFGQEGCLERSAPRLGKWLDQICLVRNSWGSRSRDGGHHSDGNGYMGAEVERRGGEREIEKRRDCVVAKEKKIEKGVSKDNVMILLCRYLPSTLRSGQVCTKV